MHMHRSSTPEKAMERQSSITAIHCPKPNIHLDPLLLTWLNFNPSIDIKYLLSNHTPSEVWDGITYP